MSEDDFRQARERRRSPTAAAPNTRVTRWTRPTCASTRAISSRWSARRAAASRPSSSWSAGLLRATSGYVFVGGPRGRRRAGAHRHGVPEPDAAAVAHDPRQRDAAAQDRAAVPPGVSAPSARASSRDRVEALLAQVGLKGFGDKYPWQLSGGMLQRASLCRALIHDPQLLLLDEPFGALDQFTREELWAIMQELWMTRQPTVLLVTHDLSEAGYLANRICVMRARPGRIIDDSVVPFARPRTIDMTYDPDFVDADAAPARTDRRGARRQRAANAAPGGRGMNAQLAPQARLGRAHHRLLPAVGAALPRLRRQRIDPAAAEPGRSSRCGARAGALAAHGADALHHAGRLRARRR